jgi:hypothetical protein
MSDFKIGDEVWLLHQRSMYRPTVKDIITRCIYRGMYKDIPSVQYIKDGELGMTLNVTESVGVLFKTLEELKTHLIDEKQCEITQLQMKINSLNRDIDYVNQLKEPKEVRESKLKELGF